ncbi:MAG: hypothetical protein K9N48_06180 [Verrucomicrobia bacterium]|nr:hypothetical protein [Verrucomicrobiota bacterium]MCF7708583.1 hypothetical protein [Verrucomicrobiota bacterium]
MYLGIIICAICIYSNFDKHQYNSVRHWPIKSEPTVSSYFGTWDAAHYLYLSVEGYDKGVNSCAFYPLWPMLIRWSNGLTGANHIVVGMVLANLFSLVGWVVFFAIVARRFDERTALWALALLIIFPGSLFYQFIYSESLFFMLLMLLWFGLERQRDTLAWIAGFLLPLTRGVGVFCVLPIGWYWLMRQRWDWLNKWNWLKEEHYRVSTCEQDTGDEGELMVLAAPILGWAAYLTLMWNMTGNPFEGIVAQKHWGVHSISNLWNIPKFVIGFFDASTLHSFQGSMLDRAAFVLVVYCLPLIWRLGKDLVVWTYVLGILPAMSGTFVSNIRFESVAFPVFIALAVFFLGKRRKCPLLIFTATSIILHTILVWRFVNFRWAG